MHAAKRASPDFVQRLVRARAAVNTRSPPGVHGQVHTAVSCAAENANPEVLAFLLRRRGNPNCTRSVPLLRAVEACLPANMRLLVRAGSRWTGSHRASSGGKLQVHECARLMTRVLDCWRGRRQQLCRLAPSLPPDVVDAGLVGIERSSVACLRVLRAATTYANRSVARFFVWGSRHMKKPLKSKGDSHVAAEDQAEDQLGQAEDRLGQAEDQGQAEGQDQASGTSANAANAAGPTQWVHVPHDIVRLVAEFAGCNASDSPERDGLNVCIATRVLSAEVQHETPHPVAVPLLLQWGATAFATAGVRPVASDAAVAIVEGVMMQATNRVCPTARVAAQREARRKVQREAQREARRKVQRDKAVWNGALLGDGSDYAESDYEGSECAESECAESECDGDADDAPCNHIYFAARASKGNHLPCARALLRAKCCPNTLYHDGGRIRNSLSTAITNPNKHAALVVRFLHAECGMTCAVDRLSI